MKNQDYTASIMVNATAQEAFNAINNPRGWWSENIEGGTDHLNDEFTYHYKDIHYCKMKLVELIPDQKVVWLVLDNYFKFTKDKSEWKGTKIIFDISQKGDQTEVRFTHEGLVPQYECYEICREAWTHYITDSLRNLITTGKGEPNVKEVDGFNAQIVEKWKLDEMTKLDFTATLSVSRTPTEAFNAINNVPGWWSTSFEGSTEKSGDIFTVRFGEVYITSKVVELIPDKQIVWQVTDCNKPWLKNTKEWNGTKMSWEIAEKDEKTQISFTHQGLVPEIECFDACSNAWGEYLQGSLYKLITEGKGRPNGRKVRQRLLKVIFGKM